MPSQTKREGFSFKKITLKSAIDTGVRVPVREASLAPKYFKEIKKNVSPRAMPTIPLIAKNNTLFISAGLVFSIKKALAKNRLPRIPLAKFMPKADILLSSFFQRTAP